MAPSVVQTASKVLTGTPGTITFGVDNPTGASGPVTAGNYVVLTYSNTGGITGGTATLGAEAMTQLELSGTGADAAVSVLYEKPAAAGGETVITVTFTGGTGFRDGLMFAYELAGMPATSSFESALFGFAHPGSSSASWTVATSGTSASSNRIAIGHATMLVLSGTPSVPSGPASGWTNLAPVTVVNGTSASWSAIGSTSIISTTGVVTYAGTVSPTSFNAEVVGTWQGAAGGTPVSVSGAVSPVALAAPAGSLSAGASLAGAVSPVALAAPAGSLSAGATVGGAVGPLALAAPAGSLSAGATVAGAVSPLAFAAPAGAVVAGGGVAGAVAPLTFTAPAGQVVTGTGVAGLPGVLALTAIPGTVTAGATVSGAAALLQLLAPAGQASGPVTATQQQGSWWQLYDTIKYREQEFDWWADSIPVACPRCGEPLRNAPSTDSGAAVDRYCPYDGWQYPRDYVRPLRA